MKLYIITADTCDRWGTETNLFGTYGNKALAEKRQREIEKKYGNAALIETELNSDCGICLGGYIE